MEQIDRYVDLVANESKDQNLVSKSTLVSFWTRHIADSLQLIEIASRHAGSPASWIDVGTGPGIPGIIIAVATRDPMVLLEPRTQRVRFLAHVVATLGLRNVTLVQDRVETYRPATTFDVITARALAPLPKLIGIARHLASSSTTWILPKGVSAKSELASLPQSCQTNWMCEPSKTAPESMILVGRGRMKEAIRE